MPQNRRSPKSSLRARRLIRATLRHCQNNQHAAARALRLPNQAQLRRMLRGEIPDTPAMQAALVRADARAARAWSLEKGDNSAIDVQLVLASVEQIERELAVLKSLVRTHPQ